MKNKILFFCVSAFFILILGRCTKDSAPINNPLLSIEVPSHFPPMPENPENPTTQYGVELSRDLFFDRMLSSDGKVACATCHMPDKSFSDGRQFSLGVNNQLGKVNSIALLNLGWSNHMFWDGRTKTLEEQALEPIEDPTEMNESLENVLKKLNQSARYRDLFARAFGSSSITKENLAKAIAQFERTLVSGSSIYDKYYLEGEDALQSAQQLRGAQIFFSETGDCFHCHGGVFGNNSVAKEFANNGLDANIDGTGRGKVTKDANDDGKFKVPTLRNTGFSAPYMHDGRFTTLEQVVNFYSDSLQASRTLDPILQKFDRVQKGGLKLSTQQKSDLIEFLKTFNDSTFVSNPKFAPPPPR